MEPSTLSIVVVVELLDQNQGQKQKQDAHAAAASAPQVVLKVYDRQFAPELREFKGTAGTTSHETEAQYRAFLQRPGAMSQFLADHGEHGQWAYETDEEWTTPRREAYFHAESAKMHACELQVYDRLVELQGVHVPTLLADVRLASQGPAPAELEEQEMEELVEHTELRAVLLEYIPGFPLHDLVTEAPESDWAVIGDQAIEAVRKIIDYDFINFDYMPRNTLVVRRQNRGGDNSDNIEHSSSPSSSSASSSSSYQVFYLDFAQCRFRDPSSESDEVWRETKRQRDEEGAVGYLLAGRIAYAKGKKGKKYKGPLPLPWTYTPSGRFEGEYIELCENAEPVE
ncbi:serine threonine kinase fnkB [Apiospora sp. TS-2023a]